MNAATGMIRRLALVAACIGLLALSTVQQAGAVTHGGNPATAAEAQRAACRAMGGTTTTLPSGVDPENGSSVYCWGTVTGGEWGCDNVDNVTVCFPLRFIVPPSSDFDPSLLTNGELLTDVGGTESPADSAIGSHMENVTWQALATQAPDDDPSVAAPDDDQDQNTNKGKGKKHKKGKKGGKGRR